MTADDRSHPPTASAPSEPDLPRWRRSLAVISLGVLMASVSFSFWTPFIPAYMKELGAADDAAALVWVSITYLGAGIGRIIGSPIWGMVADRYGRKAMFLRALFFASMTMLIAGFGRAPWYVALAWTSQGFLSGYLPAATAFASVSVPRARLNTAMGVVQGINYTGTTIGPVAGAVLAGLFGLRGAVLAGAVMPFLAGVIIAVTAPRDPSGTRAAVRGEVARRSMAIRGRDALGALSLQLVLGFLLIFVVHGAGGAVRTSAPVLFQRMRDVTSATAVTGWAFAAAGLAGAVGAVAPGRLLRGRGRVRLLLVAFTAVSATAFAALARANAPLSFALPFALLGLCQGVMIAGANTVVAAATPYERRGAAFGIASSVQALGMMAGPLYAAVFATRSFELGFILLGVGVAIVAALLAATLREPQLHEARPARATAPEPAR